MEYYYGNGEFEFVKSSQQQKLLQSAHKAISTCEMWDWMRTYSPHKTRGFMWSKSPELDKINEELWKDPINNGHSGSSYGAVMRLMEHIAKYGYEHLKLNYSNEALIF